MGLGKRFSRILVRKKRVDDEVDGPNARRRAEKEQDKAEREEANAERREKEQEQAKQRYADEPEAPATTAAYGDIEDHQEALDHKRVLLQDIAEHIGEEIAVRARLQSHRNLSSSLSFLVLRHQITTVQAMLSLGTEIAENAEASHHYLQFVQHIPRDSLVLVIGQVQKPGAKDGKIHGTSVHDAEIAVKRLYIISEALVRPFDLNLASMGMAEAPEAAAKREEQKKEDGDEQKKKNGDGHLKTPQPNGTASSSSASLSKSEPHVELATRLNHRTFDLRAPVQQSIFRVQAAVCRLFRSYLDERGFLEIHTAKLQAAASESGSSVFKVDYFGRTAFLAQSPQLSKQMCIAGDLERVYEIGAVFRAENSNTLRHLTEFTGLDMEMTIERSYDELIEMVDGLLTSIVKGLTRDCRKEIDLIRNAYPSEEFKLREEGTPIIKFEEGVKMLREAGCDQDEYEDLDTANEKKLGALVREKYGSDFYLPFYTMPHDTDPKRSKSFDVMFRGQEIISGGQRVHKPQQLIDNLVAAGIHPDSMKDYVDGFREAAPMHGGIGIGLERMVMLFLQLENIRLASLFPRDPASLKPVQTGALVREVEPRTKSSVFEAITDSGEGDKKFVVQQNKAKESRFGLRED